MWSTVYHTKHAHGGYKEGKYKSAPFQLKICRNLWFGKDSHCVIPWHGEYQRVVACIYHLGCIKVGPSMVPDRQHKHTQNETLSSSDGMPHTIATILVSYQLDYTSFFVR